MISENYSFILKCFFIELKNKNNNINIYRGYYG